ncbi:putative reverse transcriptase domain-containing protein [Tanacetum coccineum]|uniref:RNA-directed DNA polymerase n=1 Tax=Tanacetum coccineum TaxID=301880 RepID=A0ABQ5FA38_9ASTR
MPSYFHKKFCWGTVFATGRRSFIEPGTGLRMKRTNRRTQVPIGLYPCHIKEKMTIKEVRGESVMEWKTKVTTKEGIVIKFPGKFPGYKLATKEEVEENEGLKEVWEQMEYVISDSDSDLESTAMTTNSEQCMEEINMLHTVGYKRWESVFDNSGCTANQRVKYAASCFVNKSLTWWNTQVQARGREVAIGMSWNYFRALLMEEFCPSNKMEKLENEFWNLTMVGANHVAYTDRFHELAKLVPRMVTLESSGIKRYINGLAPQIRGMLRATQPTTIQSATLKARILTDEAVRCGTLIKGNDKRKEMEESSKQGSTWKDNKKSKTGSGFVATVPLRNDNTSTYRKQVAPVNAVRMGQNQRACYECGSLDHFRNDCPKWKQANGQARNLLALEGSRNTRNNRNQARGRAFNRNAVEALQDPKVMTVCAFANFGTLYCKLELGNSLFIIDLIPLGHGSFDVIVGMDWLSKNEAVIVCHEKVVEIPIKEGGILRVHGERTLGAAKALMNTKIDEPRISYIPVVRYFTDVFPEDLLGLPPQRQVEFRIDLGLGATSVAKSLYRLAPLEMQELSGAWSSLEVGVGVTEKGEAVCEVFQVRVLAIGSAFPWTHGQPEWHFIANFSKIAKPLTLLTQKNQKYEWGKKEEEAFQTLKNNLCDAPILSLPDGVEDFVIHKKNYTTHDLELGAVVFALKTWRHYLYGTKSVIYKDHKSLQHIFDQKELNMHQMRWIELFCNYECEIRYHPGVKEMIVAAQSEAFKQENILAERLHGLDQQMERKEDGSLYFMDRIWVPLVGDVRIVILNEAYKSRYSVHPRADKMYEDLHDMYWWPGIKRDIAIYVSKCLICAKVKA